MRNLFFISRLKRPAVCLFFILFIAFIPNSYSQVNQEYEYNSSYGCNMNICYAFVNYSEDIILELDCGRAYSTANLDVNKYVGPIEVYASSIRLLEDTMVDCNSFFKSNTAIQSNEIPIEDIKYEIDKYDDIFVSAEDIQTLSTYNWYDSEGHFIHAGKDMQISNAIAKKYHVEVIPNIHIKKSNLLVLFC